MSEESPKPKRPPVIPESVQCPFCGAEPGNDCITRSGGYSQVHVTRIKAAGARIKV